MDIRSMVSSAKIKISGNVSVIFSQTMVHILSFPMNNDKILFFVEALQAVLIQKKIHTMNYVKKIP